MIRYQHHSKFPGWHLAPELLASIVDQHGFKRIFEIGSGATPTMAILDVQKRQLHYTTSDISETELRKVSKDYETRLLRADDKILPRDLIGTCDLIFSRMVNEHIRHGRQYHTNLFNMLRPGGLAVHCYSTLYALPFVVNLLLPERLSDLVLRIMRPRDASGKFKAYYSWSRGPSTRMLRDLTGIGYEIVSFDAFFGHRYYEHKFPLIDRIEEMKTQFLLRHPNPHLTSLAVVTLRRPVRPLVAGLTDDVRRGARAVEIQR